MSPQADSYAAYTAPEPEGPGPVGYVALVFAWVVPGMGHFLLGHKRRGIIIAITIHGLFAAGLLISGIRAINPPDQAIWTYTQFLTGWPMLVANKVEQRSRPVWLDGYQNSISQLHELYDQETPPNETLLQRQARAKAFIAAHPLFANHPKVQDMGAVYCGIAGMLNLLVMFDVLLRITGSVRVDASARKKPPDAVTSPASLPGGSS